MLVYQRVNLHFPMVFYGFPMVLLWFIVCIDLKGTQGEAAGSVSGPEEILRHGGTQEGPGTREAWHKHSQLGPDMLTVTANNDQYLCSNNM